MNNKLTTKQVQQYKNYIEHFQKELGLMKYRIYYERTSKNIYSSAVISNESSIVTVNIPYNYPEKVTSKSLKDTAFHEMLHVLISPISYEGRKRYTSPDIISEIDESVVNTLEQYFSKLHR